MLRMRKTLLSDWLANVQIIIMQSFFAGVLDVIGPRQFCLQRLRHNQGALMICNSAGLIIKLEQVPWRNLPSFYIQCYVIVSVYLFA